MTPIRFERFEYKYFIAAPLAEPVRRFIAPYVRPDSHQGGRYHVSNLYLDTPDLEFYNEHRRGALDRFKLRFRAYNLPKTGTVFLEVKRKTKDVITKTRAEMPLDRCSGFLDWEGTLFDEFHGRSILHGVRPVLRIDYDREAYESALEDDARITFDRSLRYQPTERLDFAADEAGWTHVDAARAMGGIDSAILVELKFNGTFPAWMVDLVATFNLERHSFSKYQTSMSHHLEFGLDDRQWANASVLGDDR